MVTWFSRKKKEITQPSRKDDFVSIASHELRSPLSIIKWYTEILLDGDAGPLTDDQRKYLTTIEASNQRAIDLIRSLLNVSRLDLDTFSISPEPCSVTSSVDSVILSMKNDFSRKNVSVIHERMSESVTVLLDKRILELTLRQLVTNALMYSHDNSAVTIQTSFHLPGSLVGGMEVPEESIVVAVLDKGAGIPDKDKDKIFTKMFRASNAEQAGGTGSGLGLYIVKTIMNLPYVAGDVWFSSEEGKGSTFYLAIPTKGMQKKEGRTVLE